MSNEMNLSTRILKKRTRMMLSIIFSRRSKKQRKWKYKFKMFFKKTVTGELHGAKCKHWLSEYSAKSD